MNKNKTGQIILEDSKKYWLGACWGIYNKNYDSFFIGNTHIDRWKTCYKDVDKKYNEYGFEIK